jgi:hypothetical protein
MGFGHFEERGPFNPMYDGSEGYYDDGGPFGGHEPGPFGGGPQQPFGGVEDDGHNPVQMNQVSPEDVKEWLTRQHPNVIRQIMFHSKWLLDKMGVPHEDAAGPADSGPSAANPFAEDDLEGPGNNTWYTPFKPIEALMKGGPPAKKGKQNPGLGFSGNTAKQISGPVQWTPQGWVPKDNSHKVTTTMKPLPKLEIVPPQSTTYPEASADRDKLKMLETNVTMMTAELTKISRRFNIINLNKDDLSKYPENQQEKLKTALTCVGNAEKTLANYKDFLRTDKYQEWHDEQDKKRQTELKSMIGDTPGGVPHKRPEQAGDEDESQEAESVSHE